jgi:RNA polymerase sigma-70 factor (ECF subfamily)
MGPNATDEPSFESHRNYLLLVARIQLPAALRSRLDADDLVQQTLLEAYEAREQLTDRSPRAILAWLRRILSNNLIDAVRRLPAGAFESRVVDSSARLESWLAAEQSSPSERAIRHEQLQQLAAALAGLPEAQRTAVELQHLHGYSVADIAAALGRSEAAVGGLLRRAMHSLRGLIVWPGGTDDPER